MEHIRTRNDLISWLEDNAPFKAITRAIQEGQVENLGGFCLVPYGVRNCNGWVVRATSKFNKVWFIIIRPQLRNGHKVNYRVDVLESVPWKYWMGDKSENKLYQGDHPDRYKLLQDKELNNDRSKSD